MLTQFGDWGTILCVLAGALIGGFANGLTGFGTAMAGLPVWLQALEPVLAAQLASACSVLGHTITFPAVWHAVDRRRLAPVLIAGLIGVPIGVWILPRIGLSPFKAAVGAVLVVYSAFMLVAAGRVTLAAGGRGAEIVVGFIGGILGGIAALSGAVPTMWASLKAWPRDQRRVYFQAFNMAILTAMLAASAVQGLMGWRFLLAVAIALPGTLLGAWLGSRLYRRLDDRSFDRVVLTLLLVSGLILLWSAL